MTYFTVELKRAGNLELELWRFYASPSNMHGFVGGKLITIKLQSFQLQRRNFVNEAWTIHRWWGIGAMGSGGASRSKRIAKPKLTPAIKALAFKMIEREVTWR